LDLKCPMCGESLPAEAEFCGVCGSRLERPAGDPLIGQVFIENYKIRKLLGSGAMGRVYQAEQLSLKKTVAVKVLHRSLCEDENAKKRFKREALAASRLSHPNSITVIEFGESEHGDLFMVTEFIKGVSLSALIENEKQLAPRRLAEILIQICEALVEAHSRGVIHRDIKPENIMLVPQLVGKDLVKVLDFGIAQMMAAGPNEPRLTRAGLVCGTPEYMSPEQARRYDLDPRTDIYSLGVVMYEGLTGELPFEASSALDTVTMHLTELPEPPSRRRKDLKIPEVMEKICLRALQKRRDDRFGSVLEMQQALEEARIAIESGAPEARPADPAAPGEDRPAHSEATTTPATAATIDGPSQRPVELDSDFAGQRAALQQDFSVRDPGLQPPLSEQETALELDLPEEQIALQQSLLDRDAPHEAAYSEPQPAQAIPARRDPSRVDGLSQQEIATLQPNLATQETTGARRPRSEPVIRPVTTPPSSPAEALGQSTAEPFDMMTRSPSGNLIFDAGRPRRRLDTARTHPGGPRRQQRQVGRGASFPMLGLVMATLIGLAAVLLHTALFGDSDTGLRALVVGENDEANEPEDDTAGEDTADDEEQSFRALQRNVNQLMLEEKYPDALKVLLQISQRWPRHADGYARIGDCYHALGDHKRAISSYQQYLAFEPAGAHAERIVFYLRKYGVNPGVD